jgi:hypothetical protein
MAQMSMNIEQVRDYNDSKPAGILQFAELTTNNVVSNVSNTATSIIQLTNPDGGSDQRVTVGENRYYKVTVVFPGFTVYNKGAEDSILFLQVWSDVQSGYSATTPIQEWVFSPSAHIFYNTASNANITASGQTFKADYSRLAAGTYSIFLESAGGLNAESFSASVKRVFGTSGGNSAPQISVNPTATEKLQLIVEDVGASI